MAISRRLLLSVVATGVSTLTLATAGVARAEDMSRAERAVGKPDAKTTVMEFFSLTCSHCAAFHRDAMPQIREKLIETGKVRLVYRDYPLDQVALTAAMRRLSQAAERNFSLCSSATYHWVENPLHTVTRREALNE